MNLPPNLQPFQRIIKCAFLIRTLCRPNFTFWQSARQNVRHRYSQGWDILQPNDAGWLRLRRKLPKPWKPSIISTAAALQPMLGGWQAHSRGSTVFVLTWSFVNILLEDDSISHVFMNFERTFQSVSSLSLGDFFFSYFWAEFEFKSSGFELEKKIYDLNDWWWFETEKKVFVKISLLVVYFNCSLAGICWTLILRA